MKNKMKPSKEKALKDILLHISKGMRRMDIKNKILSKYDIAESTFSNYYLEAKKMIEEQQKIVNERITDEVEARERKYQLSIINNKEKHANSLLDQIEFIDNQINELRSVTVTARNAGNKLIVTDQLAVNNAKATIVKLMAEKRAIYETLGKWYGFNAPTENKHELKFKGIDTIIFEID